MMGGGNFIGYTDVGLANDAINCHSISGYMFMYSGGAISWMSRQQSSTALSSTHAEYVATAKATKELVWLRRLLSEVRKEVVGPTTLYIDNRAADLLARNPINHLATKHIEVHYHYICECVADGQVALHLIGTNDMAAVSGEALGLRRFGLSAGIDPTYRGLVMIHIATGYP